MAGFITIERDLWSHPVFADSAMTEREAWMWMIARASWSDTTHRVGPDVLNVPRGSFMATLREMQAAFAWGSDKRVRNLLKRLENHEMLTVSTVGKRNASKTHVTICNYDEYQSSGRTGDAPGTHRGRTGDAVKNNKTKEQYIHSNECMAELGTPAPPKKRKKPATSLPEGWVPDLSQARKLMEDFDLTREDMNFCYQQMKGYADGHDWKKVNWNAVFGNWVRSDVQKGNIGPKSKARQQVGGGSIWD